MIWLWICCPLEDREEDERKVPYDPCIVSQKKKGTDQLNERSAQMKIDGLREKRYSTVPAK